MKNIERILIAEEGLAEFGKQLTWVALPLVAVLELNATVTEIAALATITAVAALIGGATNASLSQRLGLHTRIYLSSVVTALALLIVPAAALGHSSSMIWLYVSAIVTGFFGPMFRVAFMTVVQRGVPPVRLLPLNGRINLVQSIISVGSPTLVGLAALVIEPSLLLIVDASTWLVSAVVLGSLARESAASTPDAGVPADFGAVQEPAHPGSRFTAVVKAGIFCEVAWIFGRASMATVAVLYIIDSLGFGSASVGVVFTIGGLGFVAGASLASMAGSRLGYTALNAAVAVSAIVCATSLLLSPISDPVALAGVAVFTAVSALGYILLDVTLTSWRQTNLNEADLGVVASWADSAGTAARLSAAVVAGFVGEMFGLKALVLLIGVIFVVLSTILGPVLARATEDFGAHPEHRP